MNPKVPKPSPIDKPVERLFPFAVRARVLVLGQDACRGQRKHLQFLMITDSLSERSQKEAERDFTGLPIFRCYTSETLETFFGFHGVKVLGFRKSSIAMSIQNELQARTTDGAEGRGGATV